MRDPVRRVIGRAVRKNRNIIVKKLHRSVGFVVKSILPESAGIGITDVTIAIDMAIRKDIAAQRSATRNQNGKMKMTMMIKNGKKRKGKGGKPYRK